MNRLTAVLSLFVLVSFAATSALADSYVYTYTGNDFTYTYSSNIYGPAMPYTASDFVSASFTLATALTPNMSLQDIMPASFSFADGIQTLSSAKGDTVYVNVATDASGDITSWNIGASNSAGADSIDTEDAIDNSLGAPMLLIGDSADYYPAFNSFEIASNSNTPGTWVVPVHYAPSVAPEPSSLLLLATGAIGCLGFIRRGLPRQLRPWSMSAAPLIALAVLASPSAYAQCTNMTSYVKGTATVGSDGWVIAHFTNNSNQTVHVDYTFKVNGQPSNSMADAGATSIRPGQTVGGELQGLYSTDADKNPAEIYWYAVPQSDIDAGKSCNHRW